MSQYTNKDTLDRIASQEAWLRNNLVSRIFHLGNALRIQTQALLARESELTVVQYRILLRLFLIGPQNVQGIAYLIGTNQSNVSRTLPFLVANGWVEQVPNPEDRRQSIIRLTDSGAQKVKQSGKGTDARLKAIHAVFNEQEFEQLIEYINRLDAVLAKPAQAFSIDI